MQVVEGQIQFIEDGERPEDLRFAHTWVVVDGEAVLDPTLVQFRDYLDVYMFERECLEAIEGGAYLADPRLNTRTPEVFFVDGVVPEGCQAYLPGRT